MCHNDEREENYGRWQYRSLQINESARGGGMGEVWQAIHEPSQQPVAIKVLTSRMVRTPLFRQGFRHEAQTMANLDHPHLVPIFDFGETSSSDSASKTIGLGTRTW